MGIRTLWLKTLVLLAVGLMGSAVIAPLFLKPRSVGRKDTCLSNLKQIGLGLLMYQQDYNERFPARQGGNAAYGWADAILPYTKSRQLYYCSAANTLPNDVPQQRAYTDYWLNANLFARSGGETPNLAQTIMSGDGNDGSDVTNARYALAKLPLSWLSDIDSPSYRHLGTMHLLFVDGHVKALAPRKIVPSSAQGPSFALK